MQEVSEALSVITYRFLCLFLLISPPTLRQREMNLQYRQVKGTQARKYGQSDKNC